METNVGFHCFLIVAVGYLLSKAYEVMSFQSITDPTQKEAVVRMHAVLWLLLLALFVAIEWNVYAPLLSPCLIDRNCDDLLMQLRHYLEQERKNEDTTSIWSYVMSLPLAYYGLRLFTGYDVLKNIRLQDMRWLPRALWWLTVAVVSTSAIVALLLIYAKLSHP